MLIHFPLQSDQVILGMCSCQQANSARQTAAGLSTYDDFQTERFDRGVLGCAFFFALYRLSIN